MVRNLTQPRTPGAMVPIALLLLLFHALLGADYVIERFQLGSPEWPAVMRYLPLDALWLRVVWALGVWLGFAAAFFLMLRDNASVLLFFAAMVAGLALAAALYAVPAPGLLVPVQAVLAALVVVPGFGWVYARTLNRKGVLH